MRPVIFSVVFAWFEWSARNLDLLFKFAWVLWFIICEEFVLFLQINSGWIVMLNFVVIIWVLKNISEFEFDNNRMWKSLIFFYVFILCANELPIMDILLKVNSIVFEIPPFSNKVIAFLLQGYMLVQSIFIIKCYLLTVCFIFILWIP